MRKKRNGIISWLLPLASLLLVCQYAPGDGKSVGSRDNLYRMFRQLNNIQDYIQVNETRCFETYQELPTWEDAKAACDLDKKCTGVNKKDCNTNAAIEFGLCHSTSFQQSNDSCIYKKDETGQVYTEVQFQSCHGRYHTYNTLDEAKKQCSLSDQCLGIYNKACEGKTFKLCPGPWDESGLETNTDSCTYRKPDNQTSTTAAPGATTTAAPGATTTTAPGTISTTAPPSGNCIDEIPSCLNNKNAGDCTKELYKDTACRKTCGTCT